MNRLTKKILILMMLCMGYQTHLLSMDGPDVTEEKGEQRKRKFDEAFKEETPEENKKRDCKELEKLLGSNKVRGTIPENLILDGGTSYCDCNPLQIFYDSGQSIGSLERGEMESNLTYTRFTLEEINQYPITGRDKSHCLRVSITRLRDIQTLHLTGGPGDAGKLSKDDLKFILNSELSLKSLHLVWQGIKDEDIKGIEKFCDLKDLNLSTNRITHEGISTLAKGEFSLTHLNLSLNGDIGNEAIEALACEKFKKIENLNLNLTKVTAEIFGNIKENTFPNLKVLNLSRNHLGGFVDPNLRDLVKATSEKVQRLISENIRKFPNLEYLFLVFSGIQEIELGEIAEQHKNITFLGHQFGADL